MNPLGSDRAGTPSSLSREWDAWLRSSNKGCLPLRCASLHGGNQRELARQKNMKKSQEISKGKRKEDSLTTSQRKQRDSEIMQQKQKAANEKKLMQKREK
ncbi:small EDRK-rich factor 1 isoform X2 [Phyllostomus discolor]|uniref:Small EDRK-rich factor 1 isoform X2 n=1 Tax=Phyllostomus discolor TaxID=89673 RepID=A0A7E6DBG9_9CHIR|nr:small EDRK-rich factor 1 isoform X2 [Phyllostomus discolor]